MTTNTMDVMPKSTGGWFTRKWEAVAVGVSVVILFVIVTLIIHFDALVHAGRSITFDGYVHMSTMAQYYTAMRDGDFPPTWSNTFTVYGFPLPLFAHQFTSYLGAFFTFITHQVVVSYNLVFAFATLSSLVFMYLLLRSWVGRPGAVLGTLIFALAPYRIMNIYTRGAIPEYMAVSWILLLLLGIEKVRAGKTVIGSTMVTVGTALLFITHPMMAVTGGVVAGAYVLFLLLTKKIKIPSLLPLAISGGIGLGLSLFYILPLFGELKYFVYGNQPTHLRPGEFIPLTKLLSAQWFYFGTSHPGPPGEVLKLGMLEVAIFIAAIFTAAVPSIPFQKKKTLWFWLILSGLFIFLIAPASRPLYEHISILSNLQYSWRWLSVLVLIPPILAALLFDSFGTPLLFLVLVICLGSSRLPYLYGKNYSSYDERSLFSTKVNLHTGNMNTVWMGGMDDYSPRIQQASVFDGSGEVRDLVVHNSKRSYTVDAQTPVTVVDYTFFYPGWLAYVDGVQTPIEFQNPHFRGVVTFSVPEGTHHVEVVFKPTRMRKIAYLASFASAGAFVVWIAGLTWWIKRKKT